MIRTLRTILTTTIAAAAAAGAEAQSVAVFPSDHATTEGYSDTSVRSQPYPLSGGVNRTLFLFESWDNTMPNGAMIQKVGFRQDGSKELPGLGAGSYRVQLLVCFGHSKRTVKTASRVFADNYDGPPVIAYSKKIFDLPKIPKPTNGLGKNVLIPLDTPFRFDASRNLVVEYQLHANNAGNQTFSYPLDYAQFQSPVEKIGAGCRSSTGSVSDLVAAPTKLGGTWNLTLSKAPVNAPCILTVGVSKTRLFGTIPLPIPYGGGCSILSSIEVMIPMATNSRGQAFPRLPVPDDLDLNDETLYAQFLIVDPFQGIGIINSNSAGTTFGVQPRVAKLFARGSATAPTGSLDNSFFAGQIVSVFEYR